MAIYMKILFLSLRCPYPPHRGDRIRSYHFIKQLSQQHEVTLVYFAESEADIEAAQHLQAYCKRVAWVPFRRHYALINTAVRSLSPRPLQVHYWYAPQMQRRINELLGQNQFDLIHAQLFRMGQYVTNVQGIAKMLDLCDSLALNLNRRANLDCTPKRFLVKLEEKRVRRYEIEIMKAFDCGTVVADFDKDYLLQQDSSLNLSVVPMGVDLAYFQPDLPSNCWKEAADTSPNSRTAEGPVLLFTGTMSYFPNSDAAVYFCEEIFPQIREQHPDATFYIVGKDPPQHVQRLSMKPGIVITGYVPDVRPYFKKASVFVAPLRAGSGIQTKNLEAMAMGIPVVTSSVGATGLETDIHKQELLVADTPETFAKYVIQLINNRHLRETFAIAGRKRVEVSYSWSAIGENLEQVYTQCLKKRREYG